MTPRTSAPVQLASGFDSAAADYANLWTTRECAFVAGLAAPDRDSRLSALQRAGGYFKIARSFRLVYDVGLGLKRFEPALTVLDRIPSNDVSAATLVATVNDLRRELGRPYGDRDVLSAATKFLWLRHPDVVIIHDSQARIALGAPYGDYRGYVRLWLLEYEGHREAISAACGRLAATSPRHSGVRTVARTEWFQRRVFDIHLWKSGAPKSAALSDADPSYSAT